MKNRTHKNITRAAQMIMEKGYNRSAAVNLAWETFNMAREHKFDHTVEYYIEQIPNNPKLMDNNNNI